jgi:tRNA A37 methylthiotransferase MiaB
MPCDTQYLREAQRKEREAALKELQKQIAQGKLKLKKDAAGKVTIEKFEETRASQAGWHESCVLASIAKSGDWLIKAKLAALGINPQQLVAAHAASHKH